MNHEHWGIVQRRMADRRPAAVIGLEKASQAAPDHRSSGRNAGSAGALTRIRFNFARTK
jgi:hypothetical protein